MQKHSNIKIFGIVQGVGLRYYTRDKAKELSIAGFIRNEPNGTVYIKAEGEDENLKKFIEWCKKGPASAKVEKVETKKGDVKKFESFKIIYYYETE